MSDESKHDHSAHAHEHEHPVPAPVTPDDPGSQALAEAMRIKDKLENYGQVDALLADLIAAIPEDEAARRADAKAVFHELKERVMRDEGRQEVMVGYSDSAKEIGRLAAALDEMAATLQAKEAARSQAERELLVLRLLADHLRPVLLRAPTTSGLDL